MKVYKVKVSGHFPNGLATIYTIEEAVERGIIFLPHDKWKDAKVGEYAETCDGFVTPIIARNHNGSSSDYIKTPTGCFSISKNRNSRFDTEEFFNRNSFSRGPRWSGNGKLNDYQWRVIDIYLSNLNLNKALEMVYGKVRYDWSGEAAVVGASKKFQRGIMERIEQMIKENGIDITREKILRKLETALEEVDHNSKNFKFILQASARVLGEDFLEEKGRLLPQSRERGLFQDAEDADYEDQVETMKLVKGPVKDTA